MKNACTSAPPAGADGGASQILGSLGSMQMAQQASSTQQAQQDAQKTADALKKSGEDAAPAVRV